MTVFTKIKKGTGLIPILFFMPFFCISLSSTAQNVTDIYTDYNGFWHSSTSAFSSTLPNTSHNVIGFSFGGSTYSTSARDSILTQNGITFIAGKYKTLPFTSIGGSNPSSRSDIYVALSEQIDGVSSGYSNPLPSHKIKDVLTDGINGLNIGTGVTNLPSSAGMTFPAEIISVGSINDNQPDVIYAQMTDAATSADVLLFQDSQGHTVGKSNSIQWNLIPAVGNYSVDYYNLTPGALLDSAKIISGFSNNKTESMRLAAFKLSDFGITAANASQVKTFVIKPAGSSDPAFIAYNTAAIYIIPPIISTQPQSQVVCTGSNLSATFSVAATGIQLGYQWMKNGVNIPNATSATYNIPVVTASDAGSYQVVVTNPGGTQYSAVAYLNTTISRQPSPASQTIVTGNTVVYSVSATNATSFQWKKNGIDIPGATDSIYTINPVTTADSGSYTVSVINSGGNGCSNMLSDAVSLTPAIVVYSKSAADINLPSTWGANTDGSGSTPVNFTRAEHTFVLSNRASGNTLTDLTIAGTLDVKNGIAIIAENTTLDVGKCIRTGTGSVSGSSTAGLTVRGNSDLYFTTGSQFLKNFTVAGGTVVMLSDLTISGGTLPGKINLTGGTLALSGNKITIRSTSVTNTSMVTAVGGSVTYGTSGAFIIERFIPAKRSFRFISPSVTTTTSIKNNWMEGAVNPDRWTNYNPNPGYGTHITGPKKPEDSLDVTQTYNPSLFTFDNSSQLWSPVPNTAGTLTAGSPYRIMIRGSRTVDLNDNEAAPSNTIIRTTGSITIGNSTISPSLLSSKIGGYSFVGNPYACPVNWLSLTKSGLTSTYYTWDETLGRRGTYVAYNGLAETNDKPASMVDENIQSGQAFFIQSTSTTPSITFKESGKSYSNTSVFRSSAALTKLSVQLLLNLNGGSNNTADGFVAVFGDGFSKLIGDEDSYKFTNLDENIAINRNGIALSIEGRPKITGTDTLPIKVWQYRQNDYWLKIEGKNFAPTLKAYLKDEYLKKETPIDLSIATNIPFVITKDSASFAANRFSIVFGQNTSTTLPVILTAVKAYQKEKGVQVEWNTETETNIEQYEVEKSTNGHEFIKANTTAAKTDNSRNHAYSWFDKNAVTGNNYYRIKIIDKTENVRYSNVQQVNIVNTLSQVTIFPNPVKGSTISLELENMKEGNYTVKIYNATGQSVHTTSLKHAGGSAPQLVPLHQKLPAGTYSLQLSNEESLIIKSLIVQ